MRKLSGFSLVELMIVVVIVGILAAVVYPSYREHVIRGKLGEAFSGLSELRMRAEQYFADNRTYVGFACASPGQATYFAFTCGAPTANTYTFSATGRSGQGAEGFVYTITQANARGSDTPWGDSLSCWVVKSDGSC